MESETCQSHLTSIHTSLPTLLPSFPLEASHFPRPAPLISGFGSLHEFDLTVRGMLAERNRTSAADRAWRAAGTGAEPTTAQPAAPAVLARKSTGWNIFQKKAPADPAELSRSSMRSMVDKSVKAVFGDDNAVLREEIELPIPLGAARSLPEAPTSAPGNIRV